MAYRLGTRKLSGAAYIRASSGISCGSVKYDSKREIANPELFGICGAEPGRDRIGGTGFQPSEDPGVTMVVVLARNPSEDVGQHCRIPLHRPAALQHDGLKRRQHVFSLETRICRERRKGSVFQPPAQLSGAVGIRSDSSARPNESVRSAPSSSRPYRPAPSASSARAGRESGSAG